jgi:GxxExxY protein
MMHEDITSGIIQAYYNVYNYLGYGFLERVYENAVAKELKKCGFRVERQKNITVFYEETPVGEYFADLVVEDIVIIELKATDVLREEHDRQLINYLRATNIEIGLLLNFGKKPEFRRKIFTNDRKIFIQG